jgi:hypothetical protein
MPLRDANIFQASWSQAKKYRVIQHPKYSQANETRPDKITSTAT